MIAATEALVISAIKYGDTSLIAKCLTASHGIKTYMLRGILASRKSKLKAAYFQPLTLLEIIADHKNKSTLHYIREAKISYPYKTAHTTPRKNAVILFLSEILNQALQEEEENQALFYYIKEALQWLDAHEAIANFHILFLINLSAYLGFYPNTADQTYPFFDLQEGKFTGSPSLNPMIEGENVAALKAFLGTKFDAVHTIKMKKEARQKLLHGIMDYFRLHVHGFKKPKSLAVLNELF